MNINPLTYWDAWIEAIAVYFVNSIRKNNPEPSSFAILRYAAVILLNYAFIIFIIMAVAVFNGRVIESSLALISFPLLRNFSGGLHLKSSSICIIFSAIIVFICVYTPLEYWYTGLVINIVSLILLAIYAPSGIKQSRMKKEQYPILKVTAIVIVGSNFFFHSSVLSMAFLAQSVTTIPIFRKWLDQLDW